MAIYIYISIHYRVLCGVGCSVPARYSPGHRGRTGRLHQTSAVTHATHEDLGDTSRLVQHATASWA